MRPPIPPLFPFLEHFSYQGDMMGDLWFFQGGFYVYLLGIKGDIWGDFKGDVKGDLKGDLGDILRMILDILRNS